MGQPLDTIRVHQQAHASSSSSNRPSALATARTLVARGGAAALFRGVAYPAITIALQSAVVFHAYGAACRFLKRREQEAAEDSADAPPSSTPLPLPLVALAGFAAGAVQLAVIIPVDLLKIRAQLATAPPLRPAAALAAAWRAGGVRGLYTGAGVTAARDVPSHGVYFAAYEGGRDALDPGCRSRGDAGAAAALLAAGGVAGAASWLSVYPLDVIKTRVQSERVAGAAGQPVASSPVATAIARGGLWAGIGSTLARAFVVNAVLFTVYEQVMEALGGRDPADA